MSSTVPKISLRLILDPSLFSGNSLPVLYELDPLNGKDLISEYLRKMHAKNSGSVVPVNILRAVLYGHPNLPDFDLPPASVIKTQVGIDSDDLSETHLAADTHLDCTSVNQVGDLMDNLLGNSLKASRVILRFYADHPESDSEFYQSYAVHDTDTWGDLLVARALSTYISRGCKIENLSPKEIEIVRPYLRTSQALSVSYHDKGRAWCDSVLGHTRRDKFGIHDLVTPASLAH